MKIKAVLTFLDGVDRYEAGQEYDVSDRKGGAFTANGWAVEVGVDGIVVPQPQDVRLDIHDSVLGVDSPEVTHG